MATLAIGIAATAEAGSIIYVDDDSCAGPGGDGTIEDPYCSIQTGIDAAMDGDEVVVAPGTYFETINFLGKAIWLHSLDGPNVTIIDAEQTGTVVTCDNAEGPDSVLEGFTITGGIGTFFPGVGFIGGGMLNDNSNPTVTNCTFSGNSVGLFGGGMYNNSSSPTVTNCTFSGNTASSGPFGSGGGMYNKNSSPIVNSCTFSGNTAFLGGGGMLNTGSARPTVTNCTFSDNAAFKGGGMGSNTASPTVTNCTFSENSAGFGGGMFNGAASPTVTNCTYNGNTACSAGGGMYNDVSNPTVTNCTFNGNTAANEGGGMANFGASSPTMTNCTFSGNSGSTGGGMFNNNSLPTATNCVLWGDSPNEISGAATVRYSDVAGGFAGTGNIDADPLFVDADGPDDIPGTEDDDLHLLSGSPCIDAADNTAVPKGIDTDLDGNPRFVDDPDTTDTGNGDPPIVDMGAYEFQVVSPCPWDLDGSGDVGVKDLLILLGNWGPCPPKGDCPADFDGSGDVGVKDLLILLGAWGPCP